MPLVSGNLEIQLACCVGLGQGAADGGPEVFHQIRQKMPNIS